MTTNRKKDVIVAPVSTQSPGADVDLATVPVTCGACGKVERSGGMLMTGSIMLAGDSPVVYALPPGWRRYPDCDDDHLQCAECEAEPF